MSEKKQRKELCRDHFLEEYFEMDEEDTLLPQDHLYEAPIPAEVAYRIISDELLDEGSARMNLSTFCTTEMDPEGTRLMAQTLEKNAIDKSEYPQTAAIEQRCVNILANLWHIPQNETFLGTSTVGSSEACMLGGMAMKFRWRNNAKAHGLDVNARRPNLVISSGYQVCWEKFCVYWDIEMRTVPMDAAHLSLNLDTVMDEVDEYTIGIVGIMGITYTGKYDDLAGLDAKVEDYNAAHPDFPVYIHVDGASGGFFAPFVDPGFPWDFRLKNVVSINTSGHKYGLVYPGVGWVIWRNEACLPDELIFRVSYLGGELPTMAINFSRSASQIIGQYYNFVRFGFNGYQAIQKRTRRVAMTLSRALADTGLFDMINDGSNLPIVCWTFKKDARVKWNLYDLADRVRMHGWQVPAYPLPKNMDQIIIQRIVVRADLSRELGELLIRDITTAIDELNHAHILTEGFTDTSSNGAYGFTH